MGDIICSACQLPCWDISEVVDKHEMIIITEIISKDKIFSGQSSPTFKLSAVSTPTSYTTKEVFLIDQSFSIHNSNRSCSEQQKSYLSMGNCLYQKENLQAAINNYMMALHKIDRNDIRMADIHFIISQCYFQMGQLDTAMKHCKLSQAKYSLLMGKNSVGVAMACLLIGHINNQLSDFVLAQHYYQKAYKIYLDSSCSNYKSLLEVQFNLAALHLNIGNQSNALEIYEQIEDLLQKDKTLSHDTLMLELNRCLGITCFKLKLYERSVQYFRRAFDISFCLPLVKREEVNKLIVSFSMIKDQILSVPVLRQTQLISLALKRFSELNHFLM